MTLIEIARRLNYSGFRFTLNKPWIQVFILGQCYEYSAIVTNLYQEL